MLDTSEIDFRGGKKKPQTHFNVAVNDQNIQRFGRSVSKKRKKIKRFNLHVFKNQLTKRKSAAHGNLYH